MCRCGAVELPELPALPRNWPAVTMVPGMAGVVLVAGTLALSRPLMVPICMCAYMAYSSPCWMITWLPASPLGWVSQLGFWASSSFFSAASVEA